MPTKDELKQEYLVIAEDYESTWGKPLNKKNFLEVASVDEVTIIKEFGSYSKFVKEATSSDDGIHRNDIDIKKGNFSKKIKPKRYIISSIIPEMEINEDAIKSIDTYCKENDAEFILLAMRGVSKQDKYSKEIFDRFEDNIATEFVFNTKLIAQDFKISPQQIIPETGLNRFGQKSYSVIVAAPKQNMVSVARGQGKHPHVIFVTGTINQSSYRNDRAGKIADQDHIMGGLIVEIENSEVFYVRQIQFDKDGGFYDIANYYCENKITKSIPEAMICGDMHYPMEDTKAVNALKECAKITQCKRIFFHDLIDCGSINHHEKDNVVARSFRSPNQKTLEAELNYVGVKLKEWVKEFPNAELNVVPSNHDNFLNSLFNDGRFVKDEHNAYLGAELFMATLRKENPFEYYFRDRFGVNTITFLKPNDGYQIKGIECGMHGHSGSNGAKGSARSHELSYGSCVTAHAHSPAIFRSVYIAGTSSLLEMPYTVGSCSSWLHAFVLIHPNGSRQLIISINGKWKL